MRKTITKWSRPGWQRTVRMFGALATFTFATSQANAQCVTATEGLYPAATATAPATCLRQTITSAAYASEYSHVRGLNVGSTYQFSSSVATDFITIADSATNAPIVSGLTPLNYNPASTATVKFYRHKDAACSDDGSTSRTVYVQCMSCASPPAATSQPSTATVAPAATNTQVVRIDIQPCTTGDITSLTFTTTGSTNAATDLLNAKVFYTTSTTFSSTTQFGTTVLNPNGSFTVTGTQNIAASSTGYFWLTYDIACTATPGNIVDASVTSYTFAGVSISPATPNPTGTRSVTANVSYTSTSTTNTVPGAVNLPMGRLNITGNSCATTATEVRFHTSASVPANISNAKCYYTTTTTFATTTPFGTAVSSPNGDIIFTGSQAIATGSGNYFWLTYDVSCGSAPGDSLTAVPVSITANAFAIPVATPASVTKKGITGISSYAATATTTTLQGATNLSIGRVAITGNSCAGTVSQVRFNTGTTPVAAIAQARCYYTTTTTFATTVPFGAPVVTPAGDILFNGSQSLAAGSDNYFWLAYDVTCGANTGDSLFAIPVSITADGITTTVATPAANTKKGVVYTLPAYTATTTTSTNTSATDVAMGRVNVTGTNCYTSVAQVVFNSSTSPAADLTQAKCYYTTSTTFSNAVPFGTAIINPNGNLTFTGSQALATGSDNYFWLAYDVSCNAGVGDSLAASPVSITLNSGLVTLSEPASNPKKGIQAQFSTASDGEWSVPATWACGIIPGSNTNVVINHNVTVSTTGNTSGDITITSGKSLVVNSGVLTMGPAGGGNKTLTNNGTLTVNGGTLAINGSMAVNAGATFNQSGGNIIIDGNANGVVANSATAVLANFRSNAGAVTGGNITIVDPPASGTTRVLEFNMATAINMQWDPAHTLTLGDGSSADATTGSVGFALDTYAGLAGSQSMLGSVIVNGGSGSNRFASATTSTLNGTFIKGNLTINSGSEFRQTANSNFTLAGDLINNGILTVANTLFLRSYSGSTIATAPNAQTISGTGVFRNALTGPTANFASLTINNSSAGGVTFANANTLLSGSNTGTVSGTLTHTAGLINVGSNTLVVGISASSSAAAGTYTYAAGSIIGKFKRWINAGTGARAFGVGDNTGAKTATINFTTAPSSAGSLTAEWITGTPGSNGLPLTEGSNTYSFVSNRGYWRITAGNGLAGGTYTATFNGVGMTDIADYATMTFGKRADATQPWALNGTRVAPTGSNSNFVISRTGLTGFSEFGVLTGSAPLPVTLASFTGTHDGAVNLLSWRTAKEERFSHFELLRSADGGRFSPLARVNALGSGNTYDYTDAQPLQGSNFYRLQMVDQDGKSAFSEVVLLSVKTGDGVQMSLFPNPVRHQLSVALTGIGDVEGQIQVIDMSGRILRYITTKSAKTEIDMQALPAGNYIIRYTGNSHSLQLKVSKN